MQTIDRTGSEGRPSGTFTFVVTAAFVVASLIVATNVSALGTWTTVAGATLVSAALYPIIVALFARAARSQMAVPAIGAVLPAAVVAIIGVMPPYTWRDVAAPVGVGLATLIGTWIATSLMRSHIGRPVLRLYVLLVFVVLGLGVGFIGVLLLTTSAAPF
jgi:hypothetical protein